ncbi:biofilm peroxide resistance protein BsmA, partial [Salmonella enterica subsp. enterica serovar Hillingdon]|nr:biofilm peroxide resistance protein BsmA [Salmonella enterica subsp. enterica serovar Hillingdon]
MIIRKRDRVMRRFASLIAALLLSACSVL